MLCLALAGVVGVWIAAAPIASADNRSAPPVPVDWVSETARDHPLVGTIYDLRAGAVSDADTLARALALARFPLLGEIHDNPDHHLWQAWGIRAISKLRGARIVEGAPQIDMIAMEMLSVDQYDGIDKFYGRNARVPRKRKPKAFGRLVNWEKSGWPDFAIYEPIIAQAQYEQIAVVPASPSRTDNRGVSKSGVAAHLGEPEVARLALAAPLEPALQTDLLAEIKNSHCGLMPEKHFPRMAEVQRYRDAVMADALLSAGDQKGAILIAGNGHTRRDRGVALYLEDRGVASDRIVSVGMVEVIPGKNEVSDYELKASNGALMYDFVVFTPRKDREDPCERMKAAYAKMRSKRAGSGSEAPQHGKSTAGEASGTNKDTP